MKANYLAKKASPKLKAHNGADFILVPTIRSLPGFSFQGSESELRQFIKNKYGRKVEIIA